MTAYLSKISLPLNNNHGAAQNAQCPDKPLRDKAFRASFTLSAAGYIAAGDTEGASDFTLGKGNGSAQTITEPNDFRFSGGKAVPDKLMQADCVITVAEVLQHGIIDAHDIHQLKGVAILIAVQGIRERDFALYLALASKVHQDLIFDATSSVGSQSCFLGRVKAGNALNQTDGADGNKVLLIAVLGVIFL